MIIWIVQPTDYDAYGIYGVYSSFEKAKASMPDVDEWRQWRKERSWDGRYKDGRAAHVCIFEADIDKHVP